MCVACVQDIFLGDELRKASLDFRNTHAAHGLLSHRLPIHMIPSRIWKSSLSIIKPLTANTATVPGDNKLRTPWLLMSGLSGTELVKSSIISSLAR